MSAAAIPGQMSEVGASTIRKLSWRLLPLIGLGYAAAYVDRVNISFAAAQMNRDLHFSASIYGLGAGLFFLSYSLCEIPSNLLLVRFGAKRWLARIMLTWGLLAMGMMFVRTPIQFYVMRFLLGVAEAGFFPGVVFYLTEWFPPEQRARAISRFYIALPLSSTIMGALAGSLLGLNGRFSLAGWQWLFLVEGVPPVLLSVFFLLYLPDSPEDATWLKGEERSWLQARLADAAAETRASTHTLADVKAVLADPRVWLITAFYFCQVMGLYGWTFSAPLILQGLTGWTMGSVGWLIAGIGLLGAVAMLLNARHSDHARERFLHILVPFVAMTIGFMLGSVTHQPLIAIPALAVTVMAFNAAQGPVLAIPSSYFSGRTSAIGYATINSIGMIGGFVGPYWMGRARDLTGDYQHGLLTLAVPSALAVLFIFMLRRRARLLSI